MEVKFMCCRSGKVFEMPKGKEVSFQAWMVTLPPSEYQVMTISAVGLTIVGRLLIGATALNFPILAH